MSKKEKLTDEDLEKIAGGILTYKGKDVTNFDKVSSLGVEFQTSEGTVILRWNDRAREEFPGGFFGGVDGFKLTLSKASTFDRFRLEDYTEDPDN